MKFANLFFMITLKNIEFISKNSIKHIQNLIKDILEFDLNLPRYFIQIGAGAGDLDRRANYRDGFSEVVKNLQLQESDRVVLIEPNPLNIEKLKLSWKNSKNVDIYPIGISTGDSFTTQKLYYAEQDAPHYQTASIVSEHILKHYKNLTLENLKYFEITTINLNDVINIFVRKNPIILLAIDIEGIDSEVILSTDFSKFNTVLISFEYIHMGPQLEKIKQHFEDCGYEHIGFGLDPNCFDYLYMKRF